MRVNTLERANNGDARALGAVDAADDEHPDVLRVAHAHGDDRPAPFRAAKEKRGRRAGASRTEDEDEEEQRADEGSLHRLDLRWRKRLASIRPTETSFSSSGPA